MLVLTRRPGEQIVIGDGIRITVVSVGPGRVKIGIEAPPNVRVDRQEIHQKILQEQAVDVLHAVGQGPAAAEHTPTIVVAAGDNTAKLHNRITDQLPAEAAPPAAEVVPPASRFARKPR